MFYGVPVSGAALHWRFLDRRTLIDTHCPEAGSFRLQSRCSNGPFFVEVRWHRSDGDYRDPVKRWVVNIRSIKDYVSVKYGPVLRSYGQALACR